MRPSLRAQYIKLVIAVTVVAIAVPASAQWGGPRTTTSIGGHTLAPPPSVTSIGGFGAHAPNPLPSVTSIPNYNFQFHNRPFVNGQNGHRGYGYGYGLGYVGPYYYYPDSSMYGYDYVGNGGPDLYSGPPPGPNEPVLHVIVEQPPVSSYGPPRDEQSRVEPAAPHEPMALVQAPEVKPGEPTVLVFRNGKRQEVTNYAIMGDTLYVFDEGRKKIALADLDVAATVKANDDRGMEFRVPPTPAKKNAAPMQQNAKPDGTAEGQPSKVAALGTQGGE